MLRTQSLTTSTNITNIHRTSKHLFINKPYKLNCTQACTHAHTIHKQTCTNNNYTHTHPHNNRGMKVTTLTNAHPITYQERHVHIKKSSVHRRKYTRTMHAHIRRTTLITRKDKQHTLAHMQQAHKYVSHTHTYNHKHEPHTSAYFLCTGELSSQVRSSVLCGSE